MESKRIVFTGTNKKGKATSGVRRLMTVDDFKFINKEIKKLTNVEVKDFDTDKLMELETFVGGAPRLGYNELEYLIEEDIMELVNFK